MGARKSYMEAHDFRTKGMDWRLAEKICEASGVSVMTLMVGVRDIVKAVEI
jgi:hypothetical protein